MVTHRFIGDREHPTPLHQVHRRRPMVGSGEIPSGLATLAARRVLYTEGERAPDVEVLAAAEDQPGLWRVEVPVGTGRGARPGRTTDRHPPDKFLGEVPESPDYQAFRPDWVDALPVPRLRLHGHAPSMRRFSGRPTEPLWVYDSHRFPYVDDSWPWGLVGRIFNNQGFSGTGTLVGDRIVITAGHMVPWGSSPWWMQFVPAYVNGVSLFGAGVESYVSDATGYNTSGNVTGYDWALLRLYEPLGSSLGYFGYNSYSDSWNNDPVWSNIGYPGDIDNAQEPAFQQGFTINDTDGDSDGGEELETQNCDLNHGNSGGPCFAWWNNGTDPRIVGVVSGQEQEYQFPFSINDDNVFAAGDGFVNLCAWGRANWPA